MDIKIPSQKERTGEKGAPESKCRLCMEAGVGIIVRFGARPNAENHAGNRRTCRDTTAITRQTLLTSGNLKLGLDKAEKRTVRHSH